MITLWKSILIGTVFFVFSGSGFAADAVGSLDGEEQKEAVCETATESANKEVARDINVERVVANCAGDVSAPNQQPKGKTSSGSGTATQ